MDIRTLLNKMGIECVDVEGGKSDIILWDGWYKGFVKQFHEYTVFNGVNRVTKRRRSLKMAKRVCEDWANLLLNERVSITAENPACDEALQAVLKDNKFLRQVNKLVEISFALGTGAMVESRRDNKTVIDFVRAEYIYPLAMENGEITECAFGRKIVRGKNEYYYIQAHLKSDAGYEIHNALFDDKGGMMELSGVEEVVYSPVVQFQIISPNKINARRHDSPFGASVFSDALDELIAVDTAFDSFINEFDLGKKRLIVPMSMAKKQMTAEGKIKPVFDTNDTVFYAIEGAEEDNEIKEIDMTLRVSDHIRALESFISVLSDKCGLGGGRYTVRGKDETLALKTATEVVSEKSELWQNIRKHENVLEVCLEEMARAVLYLEGLPESEIRIGFDDSVIEDKTAEFAEMMQLISVSAKAPWEVRAWYDGESEEEARRACEEIAEGYGE